MNKFDQLLKTTYSKLTEENSKVITLPNVQGYKEPVPSKEPSAEDIADQERIDRNAERNAGLDPSIDKEPVSNVPLAVQHGFKNDIIKAKGKVIWVFAGPSVGSSSYYTDDSGKVQRKENTFVKYKNITDLIDSSKPLEGQEFQGKFSKFKIVSIEPSEHRKRNQQTPSSVMGAFHKAVAV